MKFLTVILLLMSLTIRSLAQCTYSCSSYVVSPIQFAMYPVTGQTLSLLDDDVTTALPLHFNFEFYCTPYNQVRICSNGFITFDYTFFSFSGTPYAQSVPSGTVPNGVIAWNWNDLDPSQGGTVTYTTIGSSPNQKFIVTYSNVPLWTPFNPPSTLRNTGQIVLHEGSNIIEIHVAEANNNGWLWHTEGIEAAGATLGAAVPGRNLSLWTASLSSHMFSPYETGQSPLVTGDTLLCQGTPGTYVTSTVSGAQGYYWSFPPGWGSTTGSTTVTAVAGSAGTVSVASVYTCGNSPSATLAVNVMPAPTIAAVASPSAFCSNTTYSIVPSGATSYSVEPGGLSGTGMFTLQPAVTQVYTLTGSLNGCLSLDQVTIQPVVKPSPTISVNSGTICIGFNFTMIPSGGMNYTFSTYFPVVSPTLAGLHSYSVTAKGLNGCVSEPAISIVSVAPLPVITVTADRYEICSRETVTLQAQGAVTYTWNSLPGNLSVAVAIPFTSNTYKVTGTDSNGCKNTGSVSLLVHPCAGLYEYAKSRVTVFPNPVKDQLNVRTPLSGIYQLVDMAGREISAGVFEGDFSVPVSQVPRGTYLFTLLMSGENFSQLIVLD